MNHCISVWMSIESTSGTVSACQRVSSVYGTRKSEVTDIHVQHVIEYVLLILLGVKPGQFGSQQLLSSSSSGNVFSKFLGFHDWEDRVFEDFCSSTSVAAVV